ncbi:MAG: hypothetical protein EP343_06575 [Deltaproteobacteria bacterium]|nr:MAG: hypothetical protein EP343_06575 [Deltaproteobacteria bacterium]
MTRITRDQFVRRYQGDELNIEQAQQGEGGRRLQQAGMGAEQLHQADLNGDGKIQGTRELQELFRKVDAYDSNGSSRSFDTETRTGRTTQAGKVVSALDIMFAANNPQVEGFHINRPVGPGQANRSSDVRAVQSRLRELGFDIGVDGDWGNQTKNALEVYEAMLRGRSDSSDMRGVLRPGSDLHRVMASPDAPKWSRMPNRGPGFVNGDRDGYSYGSEKLAAVVQEAGQSYHDNYLRTHPGASVMDLNDASVRNGGDNRDHSTHESGLDLDIRLPRTDGGSGTQVGYRNYDRDAAYAMVEALASNPEVERVLLTDSTLRRMARNNNEPWAGKVQDGGRTHRDHIHVDIFPPESALSPS